MVNNCAHEEKDSNVWLGKKSLKTFAGFHKVPLFSSVPRVPGFPIK